MYVCVCVCVCVFGSVPSSHLIAEKELETEKKQNEAELKRGGSTMRKSRITQDCPFQLSLFSYV